MFGAGYELEKMFDISVFSFPDMLRNGS